MLLTAVGELGAAAGEQQEKVNDDAGEQAAGANLRVDQPEVWEYNHIDWRHPATFVFVLNGPLAYFHPDPGSHNVCELLKKVPRSGPSDLRRGTQARLWIELAGCLRCQLQIRQCIAVLSWFS